MPKPSQAQLTDRDTALRQLKLLRSLMTATGRKRLADEADRLYTETLDLGMAYPDLKDEVFAFTARIRANLQQGSRPRTPQSNTYDTDTN